jgi:hypothetical protein
LDYPKELYEIKEGVRLIDYSLLHIQESVKYEKKIDKVVLVVVTPHKESVYEYVKEKIPYLNVKKVYFNSEYREWPGSVFSANSFFSEKNIVLLPDSFLSLYKKKIYYSEKGLNLLDLFLEKFEKHDVVFGYKKSCKKNELKNLGAMKVIKEKVVLFKDKPKNQLEEYNSFWCCYGFKKDIGRELYNYLKASVINQNTNTKMPFNVGAFPVDSYYDLGTKESINEFLTSFS